MTAIQQEPDRIAALDGVRGVAILLVLVMHSLYIGPLFGLDVMAHPYARAAWLGWSGVDVFFVLSGFLITGILVRSKGRP
ncbi:MAG: acyltransferase family protein, partial [Planctomycetota bacterium]|nr:acyltransferase family protein [Planctomycetota bacterium]